MSTAYESQIVPAYAHPHVHTEIYDNSFYEETVSVPKDPYDLPYNTIMVSGADKGIDNKFIRLSDVGTKKTIFGPGNFNKYGQASLQADAMFSGQNNLWFCRTLPDDARYANTILMAHYRKGKILDDSNQETGLYRLEVKFTFENCDKPDVTTGAVTDDIVKAYASSLASDTADAITGYCKVPLFYVRSIGRGNYGNNYSLSLTRSYDMEAEYNIKMYSFNLMETNSSTQVIGNFIGSIYQTIVYNMSTLISDVLDQYDPGFCPIHVNVFEDNHTLLYDFYQSIVEENGKYYEGIGESDNADYVFAAAMKESAFDCVYGLRLGTIEDESIPYYRNYTVKDTGEYVAPDLSIPDSVGATKPLNLSDWATAAVGSLVLVNADPNNNGYQWMYTVEEIDPDTGNIIYDSGYEVDIDDAEYTGEDVTLDIGHYFVGGHDGVYEEISVNGVSRAPYDSEMKLLLSKDYVKAFRGELDRAILSPAQIKCDFIFDANYNMTSDEIYLDDITIPLYSNSTILTTEDATQLSVLNSSNVIMDFDDINVKKAMYDLNIFRNASGNKLNTKEGAGCSLFLDMNLTGLSSMTVNYQLTNMIAMFSSYRGRQTSVDMGFYQMFNPYTGKRVEVTATYFLAANMINHIILYGPEKPFQGAYAMLKSYQRSSSMIVSGNMIRGTFLPNLDLIDMDLQEALYVDRINYYLTTKEGSEIRRFTQSTRQLDASTLLEENNVRLLNIIKKELEEAARGYLYDWNDPAARDAYTKVQMEKFRPWIGTRLDDIQIVFEANEFEETRMMMHCYARIKFRRLVKRVILEINIDHADITSGGDE